MNNAVKFTPDGEVEVNVEMRENHFSLSVTDTGNGISLENIVAIKNGMTVNPQTDTDNLKGNGLGWGLIKELLHHLNGSFDMTSGEGMGTKISIQLPL